ncbi:MAG: ABC transporter permease subunit [Dehalococcoidia bacterium]
MRTVQAVAWKEIQVYFSSPTAYIVALIFLIGTGVFFTVELGTPFPEASLSNFFVGIDVGIFTFGGVTLILILLAPALTMRLLAEEQKMGTIELLLTSPVRDWEIILGKYLASLVFLLATLSLTLYYPILLFLYANPDPGPIYSGYLGLVLYGAAALSIGILTSTLTSNQIVAFVVAAGILLVLYFTEFASLVVGQGVWATVIGEMGIKSHFDDFNRGVIDTKHIVYFLSVIAIFLFLSIRALESRRWR